MSSAFKRQTESVKAGPSPPKHASAHPAIRSEHRVLHLQRLLGNQAVMRMLRPQSSATSAAVSDRAAFHGASATLSTPALLQRKLMVNQPGDAYEQEADRVSEHVMRMPASTGTAISSSASAVQLQTASSVSATGVAEAPPIVHEVLRSPGHALDASARSFMEPRFGQDFSKVRVHTDEKAAESAQAVNAKAYTAGNNVVFGAGEYAPGTSEGQKLLGHELTHVVQQGPTSPSTMVQRDTKPQEEKKDEAEHSVVDPREFATAKSLQGIREEICAAKLAGTNIDADSSIDAKTAGILDDVMLRAAVCGTLSGYISSPAKPLASGRFKIIEHNKVHDLHGNTHEQDRFDADDFHVAVAHYLERTNEDFAHLSAEQKRDRILQIGGFYDRKADTLNLPSDAKFGSALHEAVHGSSKAVFKYLFGEELNEGVTQLFSDMILQDEGRAPFQGHTYQTNLDLAKRLQAKLNGWELMARVYFKGEGAAARQIASVLGLPQEQPLKEEQVRSAILSAGQASATKPGVQSAAVDKEKLKQDMCINQPVDEARAQCAFTSDQERMLQIIRDHALSDCAKARSAIDYPGNEDQVRRIAKDYFSVNIRMTARTKAALVARIELVANKLEHSPIKCGTCQDEHCNSGATAHVDDARTFIVMCPRAFNADLEKQYSLIRYLIHEAAHLANIDDPGATVEFYCSQAATKDEKCPVPGDALRNVDAWSHFIEELAFTI